MSTYKPLSHPKYTYTQDLEDLISLGNLNIEKGRIATLILAGGVGSRLGFDIPKALVEITRKKGQTQTLLEALLTQCPKGSVVAIMGSEENIQAISAHARSLNDQLGLGLELFFFCQKSWPYLDHEGNEVRFTSGECVTAPRGNGEALEVLKEAFFFDKLASLGIKALSIVPIDNPLAHPLDPELIGAFIESKTEVAILTVRREEKESVGVLAVNNASQLRVVEYTELAEDEAQSYPFANTGIYVFDLAFCVRAAAARRKRHQVKKEALVEGVKRLLIKQETYLFDVFSEAKSIVTFEAPRQKRFMPIKIPEDLIAFS